MEDKLIGTQIGQFTITSRLGTGGMGAVYIARQTSMDRDVALKVISEVNPSELDDFGARFEREAKLCAALNHPHIIKVFDYGRNTATSRAYLAMELQRGGSLARLIGGRPMPMEKVLRLLEQIAAALDYAHSHGIVHRDLKPENVLLDESGNAILSDFGLAKLSKHTTALTAQGVIVGTWQYVSPEQWRGQEIDKRADIYALGIMLFEMLTGGVPFQGETTEAIIQQHLYERPPSVRSLRYDVTSEVDNVILRVLAKDRSDRYGSGAELVQAFRGALFEPVELLPRQERPVSNRPEIAAYNLREVQQIGLIHTDANKVDRVAFDFNDTQLATGGSTITQTVNGIERSAAVQLWDSADFSLQRNLEAKDLSAITSLSFSPDSRYLAAAGIFETVRHRRDKSGHESEELIRLGSLNVWDALYGKLLWYVLSERKNSIFHAAFNEENHLILADSADGVVLYQADQPVELRRLSARKGSFGFALDCRSFGIVEDGTRDVIAWSVHGEHRIMRLLPGESNLSDAAFSPDGATLALTTRLPSNLLSVWRMNDGHQLWRSPRFNDGVWSAAYSADSTLLAAGTGNGALKVFNAQTGHELHTLTGHSAAVNGMAFNPLGGLLASAASDGTVRLWGVPVRDAVEEV
jgi:serine/threonine protein kinase